MTTRYAPATRLLMMACWWRSLCVLAACMPAAGSIVAAEATTADATILKEHIWTSWKRQHRREYASPTEEAHRRQIFLRNAAEIERHNTEAKAGVHGYTKAINAFSDLSPDEFMAQYHPPRVSGWWGTHDAPTLTLPGARASATIDWRTRNAVTPVKNQRNCSSCWSFSTTGAVEGVYAIATGQLRSLSEQQLMDCVGMGNGCEGGTMAAGLGYIHSNGGIDGEDDYNYTSKDGTCWAAAAKRHVASIDGFVKVPPNDESQLVAATMLQPVSVAVAAKGWQHYARGIFDNATACGTGLDHGVLVVGVTPTALIVKNSWGVAWGDRGFIQLARGPDGGPGMCGVAVQPVRPLKNRSAALPVPPLTPPSSRPGPKVPMCHCSKRAESMCNQLGEHCCCGKDGTTCGGRPVQGNTSTCCVECKGHAVGRTWTELVAEML